MSLTGLAAISFFLDTALALGINCRGSGLCPRASLSSSDKIVQVLRDAVWESQKPNSTTYNDKDHIICISQTDKITLSGDAGVEGEGLSGTFGLSGDLDIQAGGICLFPQHTSLTLEQIRPLTDSVLEHGCSTCGSVPIHFVDQGSNDPSSGILTFNYVENPFCDKECISDTTSSSRMRRSAKFGKKEKI
ncbi:MAG: hypothetical protein Q9190_001248 [Brigantiaea leucoxantha]